jgi:hypothetical protein
MFMRATIQRHELTSSVLSRACLLILMVQMFLLSSACGDDAKHRAMLDSFVQKGAKQEELIKVLGPGVKVYERGAANWAELEHFLDREPPSRLVPLRRAVKKFPRIVYHTTAWRITWVFVDEQGVLRGYYLAAQ